MGSFDSNYLKLRKKRLDEEESFVKLDEHVPTRLTLAQDGKKAVNMDDAPYINANPKKKEDEDIAPVKEETEDNSWFKASSLWDDGYQFGDVTKTILGSLDDIKENVGAGIIGMGEAALDALATLGNSMAKSQITQARNDAIINNAWDHVLTGAEAKGNEILKDFKEYEKKVDKTTADFVKKDLYDEEAVAKVLVSDLNPLSYKNVIGRDVEGDSVFGEKVDSLAQSGGQLAATAALQAVGVPWWLTTGATAMGSETENALNQGATMDQAALSGVISAGAEILTEKISGGISFGGKTWDVGMETLLASNISNKAVRTLVNLGVDAAGEGFEEILSGVMGAIGQKLTYADEEELFGEDGLFSTEDAFESFIGGMVLGGGSSSISAVKGAVNKTDSVTGLKTDTEQKVVDKVYKDALAEAEADGKKLTLKDKQTLYDSVMNQFEKGYISTDTIEEVLGGEDYKTYKNEVKRQQDLDTELNELRNMKMSEMTDIQQERMAELKAMTPNTEMVNSLKFGLDEKIRNSIKGTGLVESYNEKARRGQAFEADLSQYDEKQAAVVKKAVESGILNNTNRTHEFVDMVSKISADKGVLFDFTNNAKLKDSGFAIDGKQVNGFVTKDGVTLNMDSQKALNRVVGHEITHVLEGTELYTELSKVITQYAKNKGDYQLRKSALRELYKGVKDADIDAEITADLVGDYLFTDSDFINNLSTEHRNVFQKVYDEIKYFCKVATAGSKEARELEKVKKLFDEAYRASGKASEGTKYSLDMVEPIKPTSEKWAQSATTDEVRAKHPTLYAVDETATEKRNPTQVKGTVGSYRNIYNSLKQEGFNGTILDASSGLGLGTKVGIEEYGFKVDDIEPYPDSSYKPKYTDYSALDKTYDVVISNAVLNVLPQDQRDALVVKMGEMLNPGGRMFVNVRGKDVLNASGKIAINEANMEYFIPRTEKTGSYQKGFTKAELKAYLEDALGDGYRVEPTNILNGVSVVVTKDGGVKYSISDSDGKKLTNEQNEYFKDSKMRDDNGNLKVMYHGSQDAGFHVFDPTMSDDGISLFFVDRNDVATSYSGTSETYEAQTIHTAEDMNKFIESIGAEGYEVTEKDGKFTLLYEGDRIADSNTAKGIYDEFCWYEGVGEGDANYKVYLNLTNPLTVDAKGRPWNKIDAEFSQEIYDKYKSLTAEEKAALTDLAEWEDFRVFNSEIQEARGDALASAYEKMGEDCNIYDLFSVAADNFSEDSMRENARGYLKTRDYAQRAKENGYDGVIIKNVHDNGGYSNGSEGASTVAIAFNSEQVKSVANNKPTSDPDIRYSLSEDSAGRELSPAVKNRFANSKVVDENGNLKVVYHGSPSKFTVFEHDKMNVHGNAHGRGFYFTDNKNLAESYEKEGGQLLEGYLNITKPLSEEKVTIKKSDLVKLVNAICQEEAQRLVNDGEHDNIEDALRDTFVSNYVYTYGMNMADAYREVADIIYSSAENDVDIISELTNSGAGKKIPLELTHKLLGYDGVIYTHTDGTTHEYVSLISNQFKHVDNKNPTDNPDIHRSLSAEGEKQKHFGFYDVRGEDLRLAPTKSVENVQNTPENVQKNAPLNDADADAQAFREAFPPMEHSSTYEQEADRLLNEQMELGNEYQRLLAEGDEDGALEVINKANELAEKWEQAKNKAEELKAQEGNEGYVNSLDDTNAPPEMDAPYYTPRESVTLDNKTLRNVTKQANDAIYGTLDAKDTAKMAELIQKYANNEITESQLFEEIKRNFEYIEEIANNEDELIRAKKHMRRTKLYVSENLKGDFHGKRKDGFNAFRREHFGHFNLTTNEGSGAMGVDQLYGELSDLYPDLFPGDVWNVADQLQIMGEVASSKPESQYRSIPFDDETIQNVCNVINKGVNRYLQGEAQKRLDADQEAFYKSVGVAEDIAPIAPTYDTVSKKQIPGQQGMFEAIKPKVTKTETAKSEPTNEAKIEKDTAPVEEKVAEVLTEEPKTDKKGHSAWSMFKNNVLDKGMVFEDISLKTGNRELQARWNTIRYSKGKAQKLIGEGNAEVKSLKSIQNTVEKSGKTQAFYDYLYHKHNVDRMSLEGKAALTIGELRQKFGHLKPKQIQAIALTEITEKTTERTANTIREARQYLQALDTKNKPVFADSITADVSKTTAAELERANPEFKAWAQDVYDYTNYLRGMMVDEGLISQETADLWAEMYPHYVPIRRAGKDGPAVNVALDTNRTGINAPIKRATGGNSDILPLFDTMALRTEQTYRAIAKNRFGVELKDTLGTTIDRGNMSLDEAIDNLDNDEGLLKKGENGANPTFTVFENGERVTFEITEEMYDAIKPTGKGLSYTNKVASTAGNIFRGLLTEYNPVFMATNAVKDAQDVLINSQHAAKTYANIPTAIKEMTTRGRWYQEYIANGGEQNTYFDSDSKTFTAEDEGIKKIVGMPLRAISSLNNTIERLPRLAEYIASRKNGASVDVAMLDAARVTTNFAAGGDLTKMLNRNGFTFLNASTQGAIQQVRNVREAKANGLKGWAQLAAKTAAAGIPALILNSLLWDDDEEYAELSDYVKDNYYIVAKTEDGKFVRIPKGRAVAVIQDAFEQISNSITGNDEVDMESFFELVLNNLAPNNPLENNILAPIMQVANNKTWYGDDLVPSRLQDMPDAEQYDETTDSISKWLGEKLDYSPYKINYLLNQYTGGIGDVVLPMLTPESDGSGILAPFADKFVTDSTMKNQHVTDFYDTVDELTKNANSSKATDEDTLKYKYMNSVRTELGELYAEKREIQNSDLSDEEKDAAVREVQRRIDDIAENALNSYGSVKIDGPYATVGDIQFHWYEPDEDSEAEAGWRRITDDQLEKQDEVTEGLGITPAQYWSDKGEYDFAYEYPDKYKFLNENGVTYDDYANGDEKFKDAWTWASKNPEKFTMSKAISSDLVTYRKYVSEMYDIKADKDEDGKSISGSRKDKICDYINSLDADYGEKIILFKSEYPADDTYNYDIIDYLNSRDDISYSQMETILKELGFTVDSKGNIYWD